MRCGLRPRCWVAENLLRLPPGLWHIPQMSRHRTQQKPPDGNAISRMEELRLATEEQMERLELVAVDLLAEIRMARRILRGRTRKRPGW
jgi:hypothetical protein